jgi:hypothetical protein
MITKYHYLMGIITLHEYYRVKTTNINLFEGFIRLIRKLNYPMNYEEVLSNLTTVYVKAIKITDMFM